MKIANKKLFLSIPAIGLGILISLGVLAQAVLNPNQIKGTIEFTNQNPVILEMLDTAGFDYAFLQANSIGVSPTLNNYAFPSAQTSTSMQYEMTVESSDAGIPYKVNAEMRLDNRGDKYMFGAIESAPVLPEPAADVDVSFQQCAGMVDIKFQNLDGSPRAVTGGHITAFRETSSNYGTYFALQAQDFGIPNGSSREQLAVHGDGSLYRVDTIYESGTDPYSDKVRTLCRHEVPVSCDEVVELICTISGPLELGQIIGNVNMEGETEHDIRHLTRMWAHSGPFKNNRYGKVAGEGPFLLDNLVPSDAETPSRNYIVSGEMAFRSGYRFEYFKTPWLDGWRNESVRVEAGKATDLGDTFVFNPGYVTGNILLAGPTSSNSDAYLTDLYRDADNDYDRNGLPDSLTLSNSAVQARGSATIASGATMSAWGGLARVGFEGSYNDATSSFEGDYEMVLGGLQRESSIWKPSDLILKFIDTYTPEQMDSYQYSWQKISNHGVPDTEIVPAQVTNIDHAYCMNELKLSYKSLSGVFYNPKARARGNFEGTDFQDNPAHYSVQLAYANGLPKTSQTAASEGLVVMTLPEGSYVITPTVTAVNPTGGTTNTELPPVTMEVGCRQEISLTTDLQINLDTLPEVSEEETVVLSGAVNSSSNIAQISYSQNSASEVVICNDCGVDPVFSTEVTLEAGDNEIHVSAVNESGDIASVTSTVNHTPVVKEDPNKCDSNKQQLQVAHSLGTNVLWPPNHKLVGVGLETEVTDGCNQTDTDSFATIVWSDETEVPERGDGSGNFAPDAKGTDSGLLLRSERRGTEDGRVYLLISKVSDDSGNTTFTCSTVVVPHDQSKRSLDDVNAQADAARAYCEANNGTPPPGFSQHGISEEIGPKQSLDNNKDDVTTQAPAATVVSEANKGTPPQSASQSKHSLDEVSTQAPAAKPIHEANNGAPSQGASQNGNGKGKGPKK